MVVLLFFFIYFVAVDVLNMGCFKSSSKHPFTYEGISWLTLREKCPCWELFWSAFSRVGTEYGEILQIRENADQNNFEYVNCLHSVTRAYCIGGCDLSISHHWC